LTINKYKSLKRVNFFIRIDANKSIGYGHFFRTLVLAEKLKLFKANVKFIFNKNPKISEILKKKKISFFQLNNDKKNIQLNINEIKWLSKAKQRKKGVFLIVDHPLADTKYLRGAKKISDYLLVFVVDHLKERYYYGDILINQNYKAKSVDIKSEKNSLKLVGSKFVLIRNNFIKLKKKYNKQNSIFANFGGADSLDFSFKLVKIFARFFEKIRIKKIKLNLIVGPGYNNFFRIRNFVKNIKGIKIYKNPKNFNSIISNSKIAIVSAGTICWELAYLGILGIIVPVSRNQNRVAKQLNKDEYFYSIEKKIFSSKNIMINKIKFLFENYDYIMKNKERKLRTLVDGKGVDRIFDNIKKVIKEN
jgi:UDP-2,4-diacetamido-2,4,6-trideoxy-beta-L-altropyranose hydrolase